MFNKYNKRYGQCRNGPIFLHTKTKEGHNHRKDRYFIVPGHFAIQ